VAISIEQQRQQLNKLNAELANLKKDQARLIAASKGGVLKKPDPKSAAVINTNLATASNLVNAKQKEYDALKEILDEAISDSKVVSEEGSAEEFRLAAQAGFKPDQIEEYRADVAKKLAAKKDTKTSEKTAKEEEVKSQQMTKELAGAGPFVYQTLDGKGREDLAAQLNAVYGNRFKLPISKFPSVALKEAYQQLLLDRFQRSQDEGKTISVTEFMELATVEGTYRSTSGADDVPTTTISPRANATVYINDAFKQAGINREATPEEINNLYKVLNDAENRFRTTRKNGVTRDLLGDRTQFLTNLITTGKYVDPNTGKPIKGLNTKKFEDVKEAAKILGTLSKSAQGLKADTRSISIQSLQSTARLNGVSLSQQQLDQYALDIQNGKDIKVIQNDIRNIAGIGMPDNVKKLLASGTDLSTVYAPYKSQMAAILELSPESINFTDPALRSAIGSNGEMSMYDFQRALRKDARWQYTNNAREDVFQSVGKVLQDFGFQG
jgi:hypothetical protein